MTSTHGHKSKIIGIQFSLLSRQIELCLLLKLLVKKHILIINQLLEVFLTQD